MSTFSKYNATVLFLNYYTSKIFILFFCKCAKNDQKQERIKRIKNLNTKNNQTHAAKEYNIFCCKLPFWNSCFLPTWFRVCRLVVFCQDFFFQIQLSFFDAFSSWHILPQTGLKIKMNDRSSLYSNSSGTDNQEVPNKVVIKILVLLLIN